MEDIVLTPGTDGTFIALSKTQQGRLFKKEILKTGPLFYPGLKGGKIEIDTAFLDDVVKNFDAGVVGHVQTTVVGKDNQHTDDPRDNIGEVIKLKREGDHLYSYWDVRDEAMVPKMGKTILGASAKLSLNYTDRRTNLPVGPAIIHAAATNDPHIVDLEGFEAVALSADSNTQAVLLSATPNKESNDMPETLDELLTLLKDEHDIDVPALQAAAEAPAPALADLSAKLTAALDNTGILKLSTGETASAEDLVLAVGQLAEDKVQLSSRIEALELSGAQARAEATVDAAIKDGFILPAKRDANIKLFLSSEETYNELLPEQPILKLSGDSDGVVPLDQTPSDVVQAEIDRYSEVASAIK